MLDSNKKTPRREFIKKSLMASGGAFTAMLISEAVSLRPVTADNSPSIVASGTTDNNDNGVIEPI